MQLNIGHNKHFTESVSILWVMVMVKSFGNTRLKSTSSSIDIVVNLSFTLLKKNMS